MESKAIGFEQSVKAYGFGLPPTIMTQLDLSQLDPTNLTRIVIDLNAQRLAQIDPALPELMRACAIPVSFNAEIVSQLVSVSASQPDSAAAGQPSASQLDAATALSHLLTLPFIIQRQDGDYTYHDNSRNLMLEDWQNDRPRYIKYVGGLVIYYLQQIRTTYEQENYQVALRWVNLALDLMRNQPELVDFLGNLYKLRGYAHVRLGNYIAAIPDLTQAVQHQVADDNTYFDLGIAHFHLKDYPTALINWTEAIRLNPRNAAYEAAHADLSNILDQINPALANYAEAIRLNPQDANAYFNRANFYDDLDQINPALADYAEAIRLNPQYANAYFNRAILYKNLGQPDQALADYNEAIRLNPQYANAYNNRGTIHADLGQPDQALAVLICRPKIRIIYRTRPIYRRK